MSSACTTPFNPLEYRACLEMPDRVLAVAWQEHIPFALAIVEMTRPAILVELGVHRGDSYLAMCQAVRTTGARTHCFGVDTWEGDAHAGFYGADIEAELRAYHDPRYGAFSRLVKATFADASTHFADESVDLLHIDGFHTYDAVRADFETWLPKLSRRGVVLLHDTNVRERGFGVWKLWAELQERYPSFEFAHGHGLGVLAVGADAAQSIEPLLALDEGSRAAASALFFALGSRITLEAQLRDGAASLEQHRASHAGALARLSAVEADLDAARADLERSRRDLEGLTASRSYRLGRLVTAPWRSVKRAVGASSVPGR